MKKTATQVAPWFPGGRQRITGVLAAILLAVQCWLLIWGRYSGKGWDEVWPSGLAALAMVLLLVSTVRRARGGNFDGSIRRPDNDLLQASDDQLDAIVTGEMKAVGLEVARRAARGAVPAAEAEAVHRGGGRYVSAIGGNALFHNLNDRGPAATDAATIARFSDAFVAVARSIAQPA